MALFQHEAQVVLEPTSHRYFDRYGIEYMSVSKKFKEYVKEKDWDAIQRGMVYSKKNDFTSKEEIQANWDAKKDSSIDAGNEVHGVLEHYLKFLNIKPEHEKKYRGMITSMSKKIFSNYKQIFPEQVLHHEKRIAGTTDFAGVYSKREVYVDILDYKTNEQKGIQMFNKYFEYLKPPFDHLMNCNYIEYNLKMSLYAYMAEVTYGYRIGKLGIIFIPPAMPEAWHEIPMPYLRNEAAMIINAHDVKSLLKKAA